VPLSQLLSFCVLTSISRCGFQEVSAPCSDAFFPCSDKSPPPRCGLQTVSTAHLIALFLCPDKSLLMWSPVGVCCLVGCHFSDPDKSLPMWSPACECPLLILSFHVLISPSQCGLQPVSAPWLVAFFSYLDKSLPTRSPGCECLSISYFLSVS